MTNNNMTDPAASILPAKYALKANQVFSASLTCSLLAAFFSLLGKQWLQHYTRPFPTAQLENLRTVQRQLDGTLRWHFKGVVEIGLMSLLQISLILFLVEWIPFLHWQGDTVSYPDNGLAHFGAFMLVAMLTCALWDPWCPYQTPSTTEFPSAIGSAFRYVTILAKMVLTPKKLRNALTNTLYQLRTLVGVVRERPSALLHILRRPEETPEKTDVNSLHWMLEHAPRGRPLRLVARQVAHFKLYSELSDYQDMILRSPHVHRLHETFWDTLRKLVRNKRERQTEETNNEMEVLLIDVAIFRESIVATSYQWPNITVEEVMRASFNEYASLRMSKLSWEGECLLYRVVAFSNLVSCLIQISVLFLCLQNRFVRGESKIGVKYLFCLLRGKVWTFRHNRGIS